MKIVHVAHGYPPELIGGTELYVARLAREQAAGGHQVRVFAGSVEWRERFEVAPFEEQDSGLRGVRVHRNDLYFDRWDKGYNPLVSAALEQFLEAERPDLVHLHHWIRLTSDPIRIATRLGIPTLVTAHDLYASCPRVFRLRGEHGDEWCDQAMGQKTCLDCVPRWRFQKDPEVEQLLGDYADDVRAELRQARLVVVPSQAHGELLARTGSLADRPFRVLPHGSLADRFDGSPRPGQDGLLHLVYWSHLHPLKGAHLLLDAVARSGVQERIQVHLYGEPSGPAYEERLTQLAAGLNVEFHGAFRPTDLVDATIDVAVIPTLAHESYSFLLDEAAMLGVPILASDGGALRERATGRVLLFRRNDPDHLAEVLADLVTDPARLDTMRAAAAPELLSFEEHVVRMDALYQELLAMPEPTAAAAEQDQASRLRQQWERRETLFRELVRIETWEDVVADLKNRVADLEQQLRDRS